MAKKSSNSIYTKREDRIIYVLVSPVEKIFFANHCLKNSLTETYRHNIKGRRDATRNFLEAIKPHRPCMFILEEMPDATISEVNGCVLVWIKILLENGYQSFNYSTSINNATHLYQKHQEDYEKRKQMKIDDLLSCSKCVIPTYQYQTCPQYDASEAKQPVIKQAEKKGKLIQIRVAQEEYDTINNNAKNLNMKIGPYLRTVAQNPTLAKKDYQIIADHTKEISEVRNTINHLIFTIEATGNYLPREIQTIAKMMKGIFKSENQLLRTIREEQIREYERMRTELKQDDLNS